MYVCKYRLTSLLLLVDRLLQEEGLGLEQQGLKRKKENHYATSSRRTDEQLKSVETFTEVTKELGE